MGKRERLDKLLVERGLVASREEGRKRILAGEVLVDDRPFAKAGSLIDANAPIRLRGKPLPYVSRGGVKLEGALRHFQIDVRDKIALDVGASTGGFTDCLLAFGAARVYAVDVGYGQLDWKLRNDPRVVVREKTNIRHLKTGDLSEPAALATIDASFISLRLVLPAVRDLLAPRGEIVALIKPQFEVGKGKVGKGGVVRKSEEHERVIEEIRQAAASMRLDAIGVAESPLVGPKGNKEFFIHLRKND
jgi:23S rRNA (cytidine1920-2'-O)/16S rRNA (cytidine1409-2'-O)-methyltransferase